MAVVLTHDEVWPPLTRYWHSRKVFRKGAPALVTTVQLRDWEDADDGGGVVAEVVGGDGHHSSVHPTGSFSEVVLSQGAVN